MGAGDYVIGLDIGGTTIKGGLIDAGGRVDEIGHVPTPFDAGGDAVLRAVLECAAATRERALTRGRRVRAVGLATPGLVDEAAGIVHLAVNLDWRDVPLRDATADRLGLPVAMTTDIRAAARAEAQLGAGRGVAGFVHIVVGTGISAAWVRDGAVHAGAHGIAGELGHTRMVSGGEPCACGQAGCLETLASARAIELRYAARLGETVTAEEVFARMRGGDEDARDVVADALTWLGTAVANLVTLLDPQRVVIGGGLAGAGDDVVEPLRRALAPFSRRTDVVTSELGTVAGCAGAGLGAWALTGGGG